MIKGSAHKPILRFFIRRLFQEDEPDLEERGRKRLFAIFVLFLGAPLFIVGLNHIINTRGGIIYGITNILASVVLVCLAMNMNRMRRVVILYRAVSLLVWIILFFWVITAPRNGYASIWAILYPNLVFFLLGKREGFVWSTTMVVMCAVLMFNPFGLPLPFLYPFEFAWRHVGTMILVFLLTYYYESVRVDYKNALDRDRKELQVHRDNLEALVATRTDELQRKNIELNSALEQLRQRTTQYLKTQIEKEKIQEELAHSQKMEAVGTLAGGLAHDFNNLLGGIIGSFNLIDILLKKERLDRRGDIEEYLKLGIEASTKSSLIIKQLLTLSRRQDIVLVPIDINTSLRNIQSICQNSFAKSVTLDFRFIDIPIMVMAEPVYIEQVLLNLCINAAHAMTVMRGNDENQGGTLTVIPDIVIPDEALLREEPEIAGASSWARIRVVDTGAGIPEENLARIFEPFYTTKKKEGGSGLGLAISYGIIKQHRGFISVRSEQNHGSTFSVYLPLAFGMAAAGQEKPAMSVMGAKEGSGYILVIDDETYILDVVRGFLVAYGWKVLTASTPDRGLSIFRDRHDEISAIILDLSMPGRSGVELFGELSAVDPDVKVILCSGLIEDEVGESALSAGIKKILHKPFDAEKLIHALDELLADD